jgi:hypothetical protein
LKCRDRIHTCAKASPALTVKSLIDLREAYGLIVLSLLSCGNFYPPRFVEFIYRAEVADLMAELMELSRNSSRLPQDFDRAIELNLLECLNVFVLKTTENLIHIAAIIEFDFPHFPIHFAKLLFKVEKRFVDPDLKPFCVLAYDGIGAIGVIALDQALDRIRKIKVK